MARRQVKLPAMSGARSARAQSSPPPVEDAGRRDPDERAGFSGEMERAVLGVLGDEEVDGPREFGAAGQDVRPALEDDVTETRPLLVVFVDDERDGRVVGDVAEATEVTRALGLGVDGGVDPLAVEGVADGHAERAAGSVRRGQPAHPAVAQERDGPGGGRLGHRISLAYSSSNGRILSRPSDGSRRMARVTPPSASLSRSARSGLAANTETEIVFASRPAFAARALRSAMPLRTASAPARPRGYQPSQKSTTRWRE